MNSRVKKAIITFSLLICAGLVHELKAQSTFTIFFHLSRPEKYWVICHPFSAGRAWKITREVRLVVRDSTLWNSLDSDGNGGQLDAFRHTYWMARLSQKMRWQRAMKLGEAHEKGNYLNFKKNIKEDNFPADSMSSVMDRFNNKLGLETGTTYRELSPDSLRVIVIQKVKSGEARILYKNQRGDFLDCNGNDLSSEPGKHHWNIPKCLIGSDKAPGAYAH